MTEYGTRENCYLCYRPQSSCICSAISRVDTQSCFVILMHPKEFKKTKNITGHMSHLSLNNSFLFVGDDFSHHQQFNKLLSDKNYQSFVLYPDSQAINLSTKPLPLSPNKKPLFILIDSTWSCSKKMMKLSSNLHDIPRISFSTNKLSQYQIKKQPQDHCLSTIETIHTMLELLQEKSLENLDKNSLKHFLDPFNKMVAY